MRTAKILQKDLPFDNLTKGTVISIYNGDFIIEHGDTWYDGKPYGSHNGHTVFDQSSGGIIAAIWDNPEWFQPVELSPMKFSRTNKSITLSFDNPIDISEIEFITKGIIKTLSLYYKGTVTNMGWTDEKIDIIFDQDI